MFTFYMSKPLVPISTVPSRNFPIIAKYHQTLTNTNIPKPTCFNSLSTSPLYISQQHSRFTHFDLSLGAENAELRHTLHSSSLVPTCVVVDIWLLGLTSVCCVIMEKRSVGGNRTIWLRCGSASRNVFLVKR